MPTVQYRFVASGQGDVEKAFTGIERAAVRQKTAVEQATRATRQATSRAGGSPEDRKYKEAERAAARYEREASREARAAERTASAKARIEERNRQVVSRIRDRHFADEQRKEEKAAREKVRITERAAAQAARKEEQAHAAAESAKVAKRKQSIGVLKDLAGGAFLGAVGAGGALIGSAARESMQLQEASARIAISARGAGQQGADPNALRRGFEQTAISTPGQSAAGIADAVARFVSLTGDLDTAVKSQGTFATIASASGANVGDVAEAAASLSQQFDVKGIDDMREALAALTFQGKNGAFELKDAAAQFQRLAASGASFGIPRGVGGVKILGGLTQIARTGTGSAEQATTAVENLLTNLKTKQTQLKAAGVNVFDKQGKARDVRDLIVESISKVGKGDMAKKAAGLTQIFGEQGIRAINPLVAKYSETYRGTAGTEEEKTAAAVAVLRGEFTKAIDAPGDYADAQEDAAMAQKQASAQLSAAWESLKAKTAEELVPSLGKLAESLAGKESLLDPFIEALGLAAEAVVWFANETGFKKKKTKQEILADEEAKLAKAEKARGKLAGDLPVGPLTVDQQAAKDAADAAVQTAKASKEAAYNDMWGLGADGKSKDKGKGPMSRDEFIASYRAAGDGSQGEAAAEVVADKSRQSGSMFQNDWFMSKMSNETDNQRDVRHKYQAEGQAEKTLDPQQTQDALVSLAATITAVNAKIAAAGTQGSIVTGV